MHDNVDENDDEDAGEDEDEDDNVEDDDVEDDEVKDDEVKEDDVEDEDEDEDDDDDDDEVENRSQDRDPHLARACAVEMHVVGSQEPFRGGKLQVKCRGPAGAPRPGNTLCAGVRSRNALGHVTRTTYTEIHWQLKCRRQNRDPHLARACAVEMHLGILQEPLYSEIYK